MKRSISLLFFFVLLISGAMAQKAAPLNIEFEKYTLPNGLDVILHIDRSDPIVALAIRYHVGSNRESEGHTGFAHLFEHMMFQRSEHVPEDQFFKIIQDAGGTLNGGTNNDATTYYEVVPKNALEKVLWLEADRMGYMINTVTENAFNIQQNVVQNEKRQNYDNQPYGFTSWVVAKTLYPAGHPYSWTVIGEMDDLKNATVDDVRNFHESYYLPNNATLVLSGDFEVASAKKLIAKYFGEIPRGRDVADPKPVPVSLPEPKMVYHEDNFAKAAQIRMVWPTVEAYNEDAYPLEYLAQLLARGKKAPLYKVLEKEKKLSSSQNAYSSPLEIAGTFVITATANEGVSLNDIRNGVQEAFNLFEKEGFTEEDVERIKASQETDFYNGISSILGTSFQLAAYNEDRGNPGYYKEDIERLRAVTKQDIMRVYEKYIQEKPCVITSFVPKGQTGMIVAGSVPAPVKEEVIADATQVEIKKNTDEKVQMTPTKFDRNIMPKDGPDPAAVIPQVWSHSYPNGMKVHAICNDELPLVQVSIEIKGGHLLDPHELPGTASLLCDMLMEGTAARSPQELEEAIEKLGATISVDATTNSIRLSAGMLERNFEPVMELVREILMQPRWDEEEFGLAKTRVLNNIRRQKANPTVLARDAFSRLIYGEGSILSTDRMGTDKSVNAISMGDLRDYYERNFSPTVTAVLVAGSVTTERLLAALKPLAEEWTQKNVVIPTETLPAGPAASKIYFVDVPGAKQSVINIGMLSLKRGDPDYFPATVMNYKLGGSFNGIVNLVLREEKGFTYGARTAFNGGLTAGSFMANANVRSSATEESVQIFRDLMTNYGKNLTQADLDFTRNALSKGYARQFETLRAKVGMLSDISLYGLPVDYVKEEQKVLRTMTLERMKSLTARYINAGKMYYVVAGDAKTQLDFLEKIGFGKPELVKN